MCRSGMCSLITMACVRGVRGLAVSAASGAPLVDMRSDTVTKPSAAMRDAMAKAEVGDDVFGDDPTVKRLEARVAELCGKEAGLFVPSGTMGNLCCVLAHTWERGSEYIVGDAAHIYIYEQGGAAQFGGAHPRALPTAADGTLDLGAVGRAVRADDAHFPVTKLLCLENTHNMCGGVVLPTSYVAAAGALAREHGVALHMDGARVWHAADALGEPLARVLAPAESASVCLSKALGAPAGSVVVGPDALVARARRLRKGLGGGMRQAGVLAAAGLHALAEHRERLLEDHEHAAELAEGLEQLGFAVQRPETNMVWCGPPDGLSVPFATVAERLRTEERILVGGAYGGPGGRNPWGEAGKSLRFVTHLQTPRSAVRALLAGLAKHLKHV